MSGFPPVLLYYYNAEAEKNPVLNNALFDIFVNNMIFFEEMPIRLQGIMGYTVDSYVFLKTISLQKYFFLISLAKMLEIFMYM